ncbi:MAG: homocysteine biosynthesis protein [Candidatus Fermentibacteraceae bacterium]|nr:homocysteine biosynthesis protein [Candidatus Fermentibacteraceae bacterium]
MKRTWEEIDEKIQRGSVVVITAEEMTDLAACRGVREACRRVDVVTTGTFSPMCSSGVLLNTGHHTPRLNYRQAWLDGVPAYAGLAAVDLYLGATSQRDETGPSEYGGGHVIEKLVAGGSIHLRAEGHGTDCYPGRSAEPRFILDELKDAILLNPRNCYQNYNVAVNAYSEKILHTYMGPLLPDLRNAAYSCAGQLSPLLNDPEYRTIGIGSRIFLGGGEGYVTFRGTQHCPDAERTRGGVPTGGAGTLFLTGDLKGMSPEYLRGVSIRGYGVSLAVGVGMAIPVLDEEMARFTSVSDGEIPAPVVDYSADYPGMSGRVLGMTDYGELRSGEIILRGRKVRTVSLSSYAGARKISEKLKAMINRGSFRLAKPSAPIS